MRIRFFQFKSKIFPSTRFFMALLLCLCFVSLAITTSNISLALVCMVKSDNPTINFTNGDITDNANAIRRLKRALTNESEWDQIKKFIDHEILNR